MVTPPRAELEAAAWKVAHPGTSTRPGKVIAARLTRVQADQEAERLRNAGTPCEVVRA